MWRTYIVRHWLSGELVLKDTVGYGKIIGSIEVVESNSIIARIRVIGEGFRLSWKLKDKIVDWLYNTRLINPASWGQVTCERIMEGVNEDEGGD